MGESYQRDIREVNLNEAIKMKKKAEKELKKASKTHVESREK